MAETRRAVLGGVFAAGALVGAGSATVYFAANPIVETEYETVYKTIKEPVSDDGIVFELRKGQDAPSGWSFPVRVLFKRPVGDEWHTEFVATAREGEPFVVALNESTRYQIVADPETGETRILGAFYPEHSDGHVVLMIGGCCRDTALAGNDSEGGDG